MWADRRRLAALTTVACLAGVLAACGGSSRAPSGRITAVSADPGLPSAARNPPTGSVRTDLAPLTRRFPALGEPVAVHWVSGTLGDDRAPGPTSYWIDAVVRLRPATAASLRATPGLAATAAPHVDTSLDGTLPAGTTWLTGTELDRALAGSGYGGDAYIADGADVVVLKAAGGS